MGRAVAVIAEVETGARDTVDHLNEGLALSRFQTFGKVRRPPREVSPRRNAQVQVFAKLKQLVDPIARPGSLRTSHLSGVSSHDQFRDFIRDGAPMRGGFGLKRVENVCPFDLEAHPFHVRAFIMAL
jgi:hypothetical protein